ncbi:hypothetical protein B0T24DRAFT_523513 [Lasiosphaeria ovina]|uniref:Ribosomal protein S17 n=1 Tax=Lasiosphaeria ovina TaxID=92902 RepID=A0AAE0KH02_9PEZI|nr:hypothetical protein B0T24DRAFT_523513 [Lasiosphaeria ovina]
MATSTAITAATKSFRELHGVVVSAGLMDRTVKVTVGGQKWNNFLKKFFKAPQTHLVHDPNNSLRTGDVVAITPGWRTSKNKRHVVKHIIAPAGVPIEERPAVPTEQDRWASEAAWREAKDKRRALRKQLEILDIKLANAASVEKRLQKEVRGKITPREVD